MAAEGLYLSKVNDIDPDDLAYWKMLKQDWKPPNHATIFRVVGSNKQEPVL